MRSPHEHVALLLLALTAPCVLSYSTISANNLYTALTLGFQSIVRPSDTTNVTLTLGIYAINYLDVHNQELSVSVWIQAGWTDGRYSWSPTDFSDIETMYLDADGSWDPRISVQNAHDQDAYTSSEQVFQVNSTGYVEMSSSGQFTIHCPVDVQYFPYDVQTCTLVITSSVYPSASVFFTGENADTSQLTGNDEWEITSHSVDSSDYDANATSSFSKVTYTLELTRLTSGALQGALMTPLLLSSFLGISTFLVPSEASGKLLVPLAILVAQALFINLLSEEIPFSGNPSPVIGTYLKALVAVSVVETVLTIFVVRIYHNKDRRKPMSRLLQRFTAFLTVVTCVGSNQDNSNSASTPTSESEIESNIETPNTTTTEVPEVVHTVNGAKNPIKRRLSLKTISPDHSFATSSKEDFRKAKRSRAWGDTGTLCGRGTDRKWTWEDMSRGFDRVFFVLFLLLRVILAAVYMTKIESGNSS
ncbi:neuronal acetylcholine receptor subunit beta-3-like [Mya arenaria]|uniref:neuronal acetylcholine receptor subunit beta-3-like n=1 Tax=Mya arenaria TaxID=6604 RepID=UPI0022E5F879|nr:neuronal acetylcholine receptor subunit beta-3-like [Mya arenaria]